MSALAAPLRQAGLAALKAGRLQEAIANLLKAAQADPESFETYSYLGAAYSKVGDFENARKAFGRAIQIDPTSARAWYNLGVAHQMAEDLESARTCFNNAVQRDPNHEQARAALEKLAPRPMSMSELASVGGSVRLPGAHRAELEEEAQAEPARELTPQDLARLATPEGSFHMSGAQATDLGDDEHHQP
ncbi:MAG: tetratricopeptide repeat protein [Chthonomonadales bacterium]|nr:tetratricopeptide repeat protein [Chthonomonadales bacterium]